MVFSAGLDDKLQQQISFTASPFQFSQLLVATLARYGILADGRDALEAVLETAKMYVGRDRQEKCDTLIKELKAFRQKPYDDF